nr:uncharacterized protein LOC109784113 [Aegilops tauschii subsp. strangulata]
MSGGHPVRPIDRGDDWVESEADNSWIPPGHANSVSRRVFRHHLSLLIASVLALLVGRDQVNLVVLKATTCWLLLILPLLLSLSAPDVEVDAEPDEEVPRHDDEDEILFPELVDRVSQQTVEDEYAEEPSSRARFDDTDDEEREVNIDSLVLQEYDGEDMPTIEWNRENPDLTPGTIFESMVDCRNAVTTYCIITENSYEVDRSEPGRFTVHCPYDRCRWRLHASSMRKSKLIQIKSNPHGHTCPPGGGGGKDKSKLAKTRWVADAILDWVRETPTIGPTALHGKLFEKYKINVQYMKIFYAKERALDRINGPWTESFQLLYTFKAEVETASPGSVVEIDKHIVKYKLKGKAMEKECFRRAFVCFKACWQGFLNGCRP